VGSEANLHRCILGEDDVVAARYDVGVNGPARSIEGEAHTDGPLVSRQADHAAYEPKTCAAPLYASAYIGALASQPFFDASSIMRVEAVKGRGRQKDINGGGNELGLGSHGTSSAL